MMLNKLQKKKSWSHSLPCTKMISTLTSKCLCLTCSWPRIFPSLQSFLRLCGRSFAVQTLFNFLQSHLQILGAMPHAFGVICRKSTLTLQFLFYLCFLQEDSVSGLTLRSYIKFCVILGTAVFKTRGQRCWQGCAKYGSPSYIVNTAATDIRMETFVKLKVKLLYDPTVLPGNTSRTERQYNTEKFT